MKIVLKYLCRALDKESQTVDFPLAANSDKASIKLLPDKAISKRQNAFFIVAVMAMVVVITVSNVLVSYPVHVNIVVGDFSLVFKNWLTWGAFTLPLVFFVTDISNRALGPSLARRVAWVSLPFSILVSWYYADGRIALASGSAFIAGQLLDIVVFNRLRYLSWWKAPWGGSIVGSVLDTVLFFSIAFAGTDVPWRQLAVGDFGVKCFMACVLLLPYRALLPELGLWRVANSSRG